MKEFFKEEKLVYAFDIEVLTEIVKNLKSINYKDIQYIPTNFSLLSFVKEHENILNIFIRKKHLLFYYSLFPNFYKIFLNKKQNICLKACFLNEYVSRKDLIQIFSEKLINRATQSNIIQEERNKIKFNLSFVPYGEHIFLRDIYENYKKFGFDKKTMKNTVWMGADSVIFAKFVKNYLKNIKFKNAIEIGSGTGIIIILASEFVDTCKAVDFNERAVKYTKLNIAINGIKNVDTIYSDLFQKVKGKYDLILVNPWFIDIAKGGLEEAPFVIENLNEYLTENGSCLMLLNSYVKNGKDTVYEYLKDFSKNSKYDFSLYTMGYSIETSRYEDYKKHNVEFCISYNLVIKKNGQGNLSRFDTSIFRKIRDFTFIKLFKIFK